MSLPLVLTTGSPAEKQSLRRALASIAGCGRRFLRCAWPGMLLLAALLVGCTPSRYRQQADDETYQAVVTAAACGGVDTAGFSIETDPASRMYDPNDPDCPPMPPDDPASHRYMDCVDCKKGSPCWQHIGETPLVENPAWVHYLARDESGIVQLDLTQAIQLSLLHSPTYQQQWEELYLSALDVTFERFQFDTQFFGGSSIFFTADGKDRTGSGNSSSLLEVSPSVSGNRFRASRLTATGAEMVVGLANSLVWQFSGPNNYAGSSLIDFSIVQPLLRAGGRTRVLERLTFSERALLANVRQMERFRRGFFTEIATGRSAGAGPQRNGGFFANGQEGFGGFGAGGFFGLQQTELFLRNQRANVAALHDSVAQLEANNEAGRINRFQVDLARQALYDAQSRLITSQAQFETTLDAYKITLGLPPDLEVQVSDPLLDRFNLIDTELTELQLDLAKVHIAALGWKVGEKQDIPIKQPEQPQKLLPNNKRENSKNQGDSLEDYSLADLIETLPELRERAAERFTTAKDDFKKLKEALPTRRKALQRLVQREEVQSGLVDSRPFQVSALEERVVQVEKQLQAFEKVFQVTFDAMEALHEKPPQNEQQRRDALVATLDKLSKTIAELLLTQAQTRLDTITLQPVDMKPQDALEIARVNRRDWKNARANLVDVWRQIYFNANDLLSSVDLTFSGDVGNVGDNPFDLRSSNGRLRVGLQFDAPLTRLAERNTYRASQIEYQRARRRYYQFVDRVNQGLRNTLRSVQLNELNFELRREAVLVAITQVDFTQSTLAPPLRPGEESQQLSNTTARDLVQALGGLLSAQNDFIGVWVNSEIQRMNLDYDLGTMQLDPAGMWIDNANDSITP